MDEYVQQCDGGEATGLSRLDEGQLESSCTRTVRSSCTWEKQSSTYYQELGSRMTSSWYASTPHGGKCAFLGQVPGRLVCIPDVAELLKVSQ